MYTQDMYKLSVYLTKMFMITSKYIICISQTMTVYYTK